MQARTSYRNPSTALFAQCTLNFRRSVIKRLILALTRAPARALRP